GFADAESGGLALDDPGPEDDVVAVEVGQGRELLVAAAFVADGGRLARPVDGHPGALAAQQRLGDVPGGAGQLAGAVEVGGEEVGVAGVQLPEDGEQGLVAQQHLPGRLDPQGAAGAAAVVEGLQDVVGEAVGGEPLPRVQLEDAADEAQPLVHEAAGDAVPADLLHGDPVGL